MTKYGKTIDELYNRLQIRKLSEVYKTDTFFDWKSCPIVFCFAGGVEYQATIESKQSVSIVLVEYLKRLWQEALTQTLKKYPYFLQHKWNKEGYFNFLKYSDSSFRDGVKTFWKLLEDIANSGCITVKEEKNEKSCKFVLKTLNPVYNSSSSAWYSEILKTYNFSDEIFTYTWDEIKDYFIELSEEEVSLLQQKTMNYYDKNNEILLNACSNHNFEVIKEEIEKGADINGFDENGNTPLIRLLMSSEATKKQSNTIEIIKFLISEGADINLYGIKGVDSLSCAVRTNNLDILKYLCEHGIRKDLNSHITNLADPFPQWVIGNAAYQDVNVNIRIRHNSKTSRAQKKILKDFGIKSFIDGWDSEKLYNYLDSLPNPHPCASFHPVIS